MLAQTALHLHDQSRRLAVAGGLAFVSGTLLYGHLPGRIAGLPAPVAIGLFYGVAVMLAALVTTGLFPRLRRLVDAVAVSRLGFALCVVAAPGIGRPLAVAPLASASIVVGTAALLLAVGPYLYAQCCRDTSPVVLRHCARIVHTALAWIDRAEAPVPYGGSMSPAARLAANSA